MVDCIPQPHHLDLICVARSMAECFNMLSFGVATVEFCDMATNNIQNCTRLFSVQWRENLISKASCDASALADHSSGVHRSLHSSPSREQDFPALCNA
jgi:hypothetical protein